MTAMELDRVSAHYTPLAAHFVFARLMCFTMSALHAGSTSMPPPPDCKCDSGTCVAGAGIRITSFTPGNKLYTTGASSGHSPDNVDVPDADQLPQQLSDPLDCATYARYPRDAKTWDYRDCRTDESIDWVCTHDPGPVLIAVPSAAGDNGGWARSAGSSDSQPDFFPKHDGKVDDSLAYWLYEEQAEAGAWVAMPTFDQAEDPKQRPPAFVFGKPGTLTFANPLPLPGSGVVIDKSGLITNPSMCIVPDEYGDASDVYFASVSGIRGGWKVCSSRP